MLHLRTSNLFAITQDHAFVLSATLVLLDEKIHAIQLLTARGLESLRLQRPQPIVMQANAKC